MSLHCPYEECHRTFTKQQGLSQHIQNWHIYIENYPNIQTHISDQNADFFQDNELFKNLELFDIKVGF